MLDLLREVPVPAGINPPRRHSELTIAIIQLVASRRGIAALPYWTVMPYLEKDYVISRPSPQTACKASSTPPCAPKMPAKAISIISAKSCASAALPICRA